jgi:hypothetical protein
MAVCMTMSPPAVRTARRNLVQCIDRFEKRIRTEGLQPGTSPLPISKLPSNASSAPTIPAVSEDAMIWGEYGFAPRSPRPAEPQPIGKLIERFERLRAEE